MMRLAFAAMVALGSLPQVAWAQERGSQQTRDFIEAAAASDTFELMAAYSAQAQSSDAQVVAFAQQMIHDHGDTSRALAAAARRAGLKLPTMQVGAAQAPLLAALQSARGLEFDQTYWRQQALAHRSALVMEQQYAATGDTAELRQAAAAAVPVIQAHLTMAEQMSIGASR